MPRKEDSMNPAEHRSSEDDMDGIGAPPRTARLRGEETAPKVRVRRRVCMLTRVVCVCIEFLFCIITPKGQGSFVKLANPSRSYS